MLESTVAFHALYFMSPPLHYISFFLLTVTFCLTYFAYTLQIIDENSLIKQYQNEIRSLKEELEQLKRGIATSAPSKDMGEDDILLLKQKVCIFDLFYNLWKMIFFFSLLVFLIDILNLLNVHLKC